MPLRVASEQVEQRRRILGDRLVGGEEAQIGVGRRRRRVVVASAQMNVAAEPEAEAFGGSAAVAGEGAAVGLTGSSGGGRGRSAAGKTRKSRS